MATSVITGTILDGAGTAIPNVKVTCRLYPRPAFRTSDGVSLSGIVEDTTDSNGVYTFTLTETADITPADSWYVITEYLSDRYGGPMLHRIQVGADAATVLESLVTELT